MPGRIWPRGYCRGVAGLGGAWVRPPVGLIWSPAVFSLAVWLGDPWSHCGGVAACWLDTESLSSSVLLPGRGCSRFGAGAWVPVGLLLGLVVSHPVRVCVCACVRVVGVDEAIKGH